MYLGYDSVEMLGHIVEDGQLKPVPGKMEAIKKLTPPASANSTCKCNGDFLELTINHLFLMQYGTYSFSRVVGVYPKLFAWLG